jgi:multidrug efflux pump subunit AcrA (membrane-fusion protein)
MRRRYQVLVPGLAAAMFGLAIYHVVRASQTLPAPLPPAEPARTPFARTIAGAGLVEAQTENIAIGSALSGVVLEVYVPVGDVGKQVRAGDALFRVDDRHLRAQLEYQEASCASARAQLAKLDQQPRAEELPPSAAKVRAAQANVALQRDLAERARRLAASEAMSREDVNQRLLTLEVARQQLAQAEADDRLLRAGAWEADKAVARAAVAMAAAQAKQTRTEIERALVRAPVDGRVLQVNVRPGEYVGNQAGQALMVLGHARRLHVRVDIDERDVDRFRPGLPARAVTRGAARLSYPLTFVRVEPYIIPKKSLTGDNTERVDTRVLQVIYALDAGDRPVYVGQQLDVFMDADTTGGSSQAR